MNGFYFITDCSLVFNNVWSLFQVKLVVFAVVLKWVKTMKTITFYFIYSFIYFAVAGLLFIFLISSVEIPLTISRMIHSFDSSEWPLQWRRRMSPRADGSRVSLNDVVVHTDAVIILWTEQHNSRHTGRTPEHSHGTWVCSCVSITERQGNKPLHSDTLENQPNTTSCSETWGTTAQNNLRRPARHRHCFTLQDLFNTTG